MRYEHGGNPRARTAGDHILKLVLGPVPAMPTIKLGGTPQKYVLADGATVKHGRQQR